MGSETWAESWERIRWRNSSRHNMKMSGRCLARNHWGIHCMPLCTTSCLTHSLFVCINFFVHFFLISLLCPFYLPFFLFFAVLHSDLDMGQIMAKGLDKLPPNPVLIETPVSLSVYPMTLWHRGKKKQHIINYRKTNFFSFWCLSLGMYYKYICAPLDLIQGFAFVYKDSHFV